MDRQQPVSKTKVLTSRCSLTKEACSFAHLSGERTVPPLLRAMPPINAEKAADTEMPITGAAAAACSAALLPPLPKQPRTSGRHASDCSMELAKQVLPRFRSPTQPCSKTMSQCGDHRSKPRCRWHEVRCIDHPLTCFIQTGSQREQHNIISGTVQCREAHFIWVQLCQWRHAADCDFAAVQRMRPCARRELRRRCGRY